jgi:hypothetical protein
VCVCVPSCDPIYYTIYTPPVIDLLHNTHLADRLQLGTPLDTVLGLF